MVSTRASSYRRLISSGCSAILRRCTKMLETLEAARPARGLLVALAFPVQQ